MARIKVGSIKGDGGAFCELNVNVTGDGEPLLLIMGFGMSGDMWLQSLPHLSQFRTIYFDNRGTGQSDAPEGPYSVEQMAEDAAGILDALSVDRAHVFGVSMGGMIAQELALRHPTRVRSLVLGATTPGGPGSVPADPGVIERLVEAVECQGSDPERSVELTLPLLFPPDFLEAQPMLKPLMVAAIGLLPPTPRETARRALSGIASWSSLERLAQIRASTLIVHGTEDALIPVENADLLERGIPNARKIIFPGEGHGLGARDPVGFFRSIVDFLSA